METEEPQLPDIIVFVQVLCMGADQEGIIVASVLTGAVGVLSGPKLKTLMQRCTVVRRKVRMDDVMSGLKAETTEDGPHRDKYHEEGEQDRMDRGMNCKTKREQGEAEPRKDKNIL